MILDMLFFCCALPCEAEPIIKRFSLKLISSPSPFPIYQNREVYLIISGIGKIPTAMACAMLYNQKQMNTPIWLNVGVAGHRDHPLGIPFLIHKIIDASRKYAFYPSFAFTSPCPTEVLTTVETPEAIFSENTLSD